MTGLLHAGGVLADATLRRLRPVDVRTAFAPKVSGAAAALSVCAGAPIGAAAIFSSIAGAVGSAGQAGYAGANAWLDARAAQMHAEVCRTCKLFPVCYDAVCHAPHEEASACHRATTGAGHQHPERRLGRLGQRRNGSARRPGSHGALGHWRYSPNGRLGGHGQAAVKLPCWVAMLTGHRMRHALGQVRRVYEEAAVSRVTPSVQGLFTQMFSKPI